MVALHRLRLGPQAGGFLALQTQQFSLGPARAPLFQREAGAQYPPVDPVLTLRRSADDRMGHSGEAERAQSCGQSVGGIGGKPVGLVARNFLRRGQNLEIVIVFREVAYDGRPQVVPIQPLDSVQGIQPRQRAHRVAHTRGGQGRDAGRLDPHRLIA